MKMIRGNSILNWPYMKQHGGMDLSEYIEWNYSKKKISDCKIIFVSHRWVAASHPDPRGEQLRELQRRLLSLFEQDRSFSNCVIFYDYASIPQKPYTNAGDTTFHQDISSLGCLLSVVDKVIVLSEGYSDYKDRAWCFFEVVMAKKKFHFFDDQKLIENEIRFLGSLAFEESANRQIADLGFNYNLHTNKIKYILMIFQHLESRKITNSDDLPLIKRQMIAYLNKM